MENYFTIIVSYHDNLLKYSLFMATMTDTYEYDIIRIEKKGILNVELKEDYRELIKEKARDGWRLVQIFAPPIEGYGVIKFVDVIFERKSVF